MCFLSNLGKLILKAFFFEMWTCPQQPANGRQWGSTFMARCFEMTEGCDECVREDGRQQMMGWSGVESELLNIRMWKISNRILACSQYVQLLKPVANVVRDCQSSSFCALLIFARKDKQVFRVLLIQFLLIVTPKIMVGRSSLGRLMW